MCSFDFLLLLSHFSTTTMIWNPSAVPWSCAHILVAILAMIPMAASLSQYQSNGGQRHPSSKLGIVYLDLIMKQDCHPMAC